MGCSCGGVGVDKLWGKLLKHRVEVLDNVTSCLAASYVSRLRYTLYFDCPVYMQVEFGPVSWCMTWSG